MKKPRAKKSQRNKVRFSLYLSDTERTLLRRLAREMAECENVILRLALKAFAQKK